jgi:hypothetical protein
MVAPGHAVTLRLLLGSGLSALWLGLVLWGFWQTEWRPLQQRFAVTAQTQAQVAQWEQWFRASTHSMTAPTALLIINSTAACSCEVDAPDFTSAWTDLQAQGLRIVDQSTLRSPAFPNLAHAALTLFSAQGKLLYAGPASLGDGCGHLSLPAVLAQGLQANEAPFGTPIVADSCDCPPNET